MIKFVKIREFSPERIMYGTTMLIGEEMFEGIKVISVTDM